MKPCGTNRGSFAGTASLVSPPAEDFWSPYDEDLDAFLSKAPRPDPGAEVPAVGGTAVGQGAAVGHGEAAVEP